MSVPLRQQLSVGRYLIKQKLKGVKRYPLVLMLEPLFRCNLACAGCGKIDYPDDILNKRLSVEECLTAVDECDAPMVSIPGGEPLIHKEMPQIVEGIIARKKFVYLCTNALLLKKRIDDYTPSPYLTFSIHLDGNRDRHDNSAQVLSNIVITPRSFAFATIAGTSCTSMVIEPGDSKNNTRVFSFINSSMPAPIPGG